MTVSMQHSTSCGKINWKTKTSDKDRSEARWLWHKGHSTYEISHSLGIYEAVIWNNLEKWRGK